MRRLTAHLPLLRRAALDLAGGVLLLVALFLAATFAANGRGPVRALDVSAAKLLCGESLDVDAPTDTLRALDLEFVFLSRTRSFQDFSYSDNGPPMPLLINPLSLYQTSPRDYELGYDDGRNPAAYTSWSGGGWQRVEMHLADETLTISVNGAPVFERAGAFVFGAAGTLGRGYADRTWCGWVRAFSLTTTDMEGKAMRLRLSDDRIVGDEPGGAN